MHSIFIEEAFRLIVEVGIKGVLIIALALGFTRLLRHATLRHLTWGIAFGALLVLPVLPFIAPAWYVPGVAIVANAEAVNENTQRNAPSEAGVSTGILPQMDASTTKQATVEAGDKPFAWDRMLDRLPTMVFGLWLLGAIVMGGRLLMEMGWVYRCTRSAAKIPEAQTKRFQEQLHNRRVRIGVSERVQVPMVWGIFRPMILLPPGYSTWSADQQEAVLLHELAHIRRLDVLLHILAYLALSMHWFNPLVHQAYRRFCSEAEHVADQAVVAAGTSPVAYASHLIAVAREMTDGKPSNEPVVIATMARTGEMRERIETLLSTQTDCTQTARRWNASLLCAAALVVAAPITTVGIWCVCTSTACTVAHQTPNEAIPNTEDVAPAAAGCVLDETVPSTSLSNTGY